MLATKKIISKKSVYQEYSESLVSSRITRLEQESFELRRKNSILEADNNRLRKLIYPTFHNEDWNEKVAEVVKNRADCIGTLSALYVGLRESLISCLTNDQKDTATLFGLSNEMYAINLLKSFIGGEIEPGKENKENKENV